MTAEEFARWPEALVGGDADRRSLMTRAELTTDCTEIVNGESRPAFVAFFPAGAFVVTIAKVGERG